MVFAAPLPVMFGVDGARMADSAPAATTSALDPLTKLRGCVESSVAECGRASVDVARLGTVSGSRMM